MKWRQKDSVFPDIDESYIPARITRDSDNEWTESARVKVAGCAAGYRAIGRARRIIEITRLQEVLGQRDVTDKHAA